MRGVFNTLLGGQSGGGDGKSRPTEKHDSIREGGFTPISKEEGGLTETIIHGIEEGAQHLARNSKFVRGGGK